MRFYNPTKRFKETKLSLESIPFRFGPNKRQELTRLIYELSRIKNATPKSILQEALKDDNFQGAKQAFTHLKDFLLQQRFPESYKNKKGLGFYLPRINIDGKNAVIKNRLIDFYPEEIFVENKARDYKLAESIIEKFPLAKVKTIDSLKSYISFQHRGSAVANYNKRTAKLFLVKERHDFLKSCPCSKGVIGCGYHILNLGFGCPYECS